MLVARLLIMYSGLGLSPRGVQIPAQPLPISVTLGESLHFSIKRGWDYNTVLTDFRMAQKEQ